MRARLLRFFVGTLRRQIIVGVALVHAVMMVLFVWDLTERQQALLLERQIEHASALAQTIATSSAGWLVARDFNGLQEIIQSQRRYPELQFALITEADSRVVAHTEAARIGQYVSDFPAAGGGAASPEVSVMHRTAELVDVAAPIVLAGRQVGWVRIGLGQQASRERLHAITRDGIFYALAAILIGTLLARIMGLRLTRRLDAIQRVADAIQSGDRSQRAAQDGSDETASLARAFNAMLDALAQREAALHESEAKLATILDNVDAFIYLKDAAGRYLYANRRVRELFHAELAEIVGQDDERFFAAETVRALKANDRAVLVDGETLRREETNVDLSTGHTTTYWSVKLQLRRDDGTIYALCGISTDISERKRAEQALQDLNAELEERVSARTHELEVSNAKLIQARDAAEAANRAKSTFLANMSHEIRTPLHAITGMAHLIRRAGVNPGQQRWLDKIDAAEQHLLDIINAILDLSKIEAGKFVLAETEVRIDEIVANVAAMVADQVQARGISLVVDNGSLPGSLLGDPTRLRQGLLNYANNAAKFTEAGTITLRTRQEEDAPDSVLVRFEVEDTGIGIAADIIPRLFSAFEQADGSMTRKYGGTGLGLAITKKLAELMGGTAGVASTPGSGSTFWFTARLKKAAQPAEPAVHADALAEAILKRDYGDCRLLVVDDDADNRDITRELLKSIWPRVDTAADGAEAVDLAARNAYDLILMDVRMPRMDGLEATRRIRALPQGAGLPILAMTANVFPEERTQCLEAGMNDVIPKATHAEAPFAMILKWLSRRRSEAGDA